MRGWREEEWVGNVCARNRQTDRVHIDSQSEYVRERDRQKDTQPASQPHR